MIPALMLFRSLVEQNKMPIEAFTIHVHSLAAEENPKVGANLRKVPGQASDAKLRSFLADCTRAAPLV